MIRSKDSFLNKIKRVIFQGSHLSPYLFLLRENITQKIQRIFEDKSVNNQQDQKLNKNLNNITNTLNQVNFLQSTLSIQNRRWNPISRGMLVWYVIVFAAIMYYFVQTGMMITYGQVAWQDQLSNRYILGFDILFILVFIVDMFVQFKTGFLYRGIIVTEKARVLSRYLHYYFIFDIVLVLVLLITILSQVYAMNFVKLLIVFKFIRMFELDDFYMRRLSVNTTGKVLYVIGKQIITIFTLSHIIGLIFYLIDNALVNTSVCQPAPNNGLCWLYSATAFSPINSYSWQIQYFYTLYWGINTITTISYGDIAPNNPYQTQYAIYMFYFGFVVYGYVGNSIIKIILWAKNLTDKYRAEIIIMDTYMRNLKVKKQIQQQTRDYIQYLYLDQKNRNTDLQNQMKSKLPEDVRFQLLREAYSSLYDGFTHILPNCPEIKTLLFCIKQQQYSSNQTIIMQGAFVNKVHYLHKGQITLQCTYNQVIYELAKLKTIDQFVALYEFILKQRISFSVITEKGAIFYFVEGERLKIQAEKSANLRQKFKLVEYQLRYIKNYKAIMHYCYFCHGNHNWNECSDNMVCFNKVSLKGYKTQTDKMTRISRSKYSILKRKQIIQKQQGENTNKTDPVINKIKDRIFRLKQQIRKKRKDFDIDIIYQWSYYLASQNFSKLKEKWNKPITQKRYTLYGVFKSQKLS